MGQALVARPQVDFRIQVSSTLTHNHLLPVTRDAFSRQTRSKAHETAPWFHGSWEQEMFWSTGVALLVSVLTPGRFRTSRAPGQSASWPTTDC